jgi:hypothetical protein
MLRICNITASKVIDLADQNLLVEQYADHQVD